MTKNTHENNISVLTNTQTAENAYITKKLSFKKETLRNLVTLAEREYFDSKMKPEDKLSEMLDKIINEHYVKWLLSNNQYIKDNSL
ncbi:MAG: hypothetical protein ACK5WP_09500 [Neisseriaceae bacterium]